MPLLISRLGRWRRPALVAAGLLVAFAGYETLTTFVAYTADAYVRSDLVALAPEVGGRVIAVEVTDNQPVRQGAQVAMIDPVPYALAVAQTRAQIAEATALLKADQDAIAAAQDADTAAAASAELAKVTEARVAALQSRGDSAQQDLDQAQADLRRSMALRQAATAAVGRAQAMADAHQATLSRLQAELALAEWRLDRTKLIAPADGTINNLTLRPGDTATAGVPLVGLVDAAGWRVIANLRESHLSRLRQGQAAWVMLDSHPWQVFRGRVVSLGRGISREPGVEGLLPYVSPTTDWIRLQRRFPVTLALEDPPKALFMGSSARVLVVP